ncbi:MAG: FecR domain-containing protein [Balneolaceae bacterium]|nr:FecR domain-containing protein [Balneolaceae bacterium]
MTDQQHIPENDRDLQLARTIGSRLESGSQLSDIDDPVVSLLLEYRRQVGLDSTVYTPQSDKLWSRINRATNPESDSGTAAPIHSIRTGERRWIWAVAASLLIIAFAGYYYLMAPAQPTLVAESQQVLKSVTLGDGSRVTLRPYSKIYLVDRNREGVQYRLSGEAYFDVATNPDRQFSVGAGNGRVSVLGTRFVLSNWGDLVQVFLEEGSVRFETADRTQSTVLEPGQFAAITGARTLEEPQPADISQFTDWMNNELSFRNREAEYVFSELEQHFNIEIEAPEAVLNTRIGGSLSLAQLDSSLTDLGTVLGGTFNSAGENTYRFVPVEN